MHAHYENIEWKKDGNFTVNLTIVSFKISAWSTSFDQSRDNLRDFYLMAVS